MNQSIVLDILASAFVFFGCLILLVVLISYFYLTIYKVRESVRQRNKIKKEKLRRAIIENTRNLERVWSNKGLGKDLEEGIKKEQERLRANLE